MAIVTREARPEEYAEAGRVTAEAYREFVPAAGKTSLTLHTTKKMHAAQRMYERLGYVRDADRVFPDGFVLLGYRKELSGSIT